MQNGTYSPLGRPLFIYPNADALKRPEVLAFVEDYVTNHATVAEEAKFIPLNSEQEESLKASLTKLKESAGT